MVGGSPHYLLLVVLLSSYWCLGHNTASSQLFTIATTHTTLYSEEPTHQHLFLYFVSVTNLFSSVCFQLNLGSSIADRSEQLEILSSNMRVSSVLVASFAAAMTQAESGPIVSTEVGKSLEMEAEAPCGGFDPSDLTQGCTEWPVLSQTINLVSAHSGVT
jgi:hypothetical protein